LFFVRDTSDGDLTVIVWRQLAFQQETNKLVQGRQGFEETGKL